MGLSITMLDVIEPLIKDGYKLPLNQLPIYFRYVKKDLQKIAENLNLHEEKIMETAWKIFLEYYKQYLHSYFNRDHALASSMVMSVWVNKYPIILEHVYDAAGVSRHFVLHVMMQIEQNVLSELDFELPERNYKYWVDTFSNKLSLSKFTKEAIWKNLRFLQISSFSRTDETRANNILCIIYFLLKSEQIEAYDQKLFENVVAKILCPKKKMEGFLSIYNDFTKSLERFENFIPRLVQKIKDGESLDEYDIHYPLYARYSDLLKETCMFNPNPTAKKVLELIKDNSFVPLKNSEFKIWK